MTGTNGKTITTVALYARVSTLDKDQNPETQLHELREYCQAKSLRIAAEYVDHGVSGAKHSRPQLNRLIEAAKRTEFDAVMVWRLDRFGRSVPHLVNTIADLDKLGVAFISLKENIDLSTPIGRLQFHILSALAQFNREMIVENVRSGLKNAKAKGKRLGRKERTDIDVSALLALRDAGMSWRKIAAQTGIPMSTVKDRCTVNPRKLGVCA